VNNTSVKPTLPKYRTHDELQEPWAHKFRELLDMKWTFPDYLSSAEEFNEVVKAFHEALTETSNTVLIPKAINPRPSFWFNNLCRSAVRKVRDARRLHRLQPSQTELAMNFHKETTSFKLSIRKSKRLGAMELANKVTHANIWRMNDWYRGKRRMFSPVLTDERGNTAVHPKDKMEMMHESFFSPPKPLKGDFSWEGTNESTRTFVPVTVQEIRNTLTSTSNTSAPGASSIGYKVLKWAFTEAPDEMTAIVRASLKLGIHHPKWKSLLVVVIPKAKKPSYSDPKAWRPIQLLDTLGKLIEKIMARRIIYQIGKYNLTPMEQFGGRSNSSCQDALISLTHDIQTAWKQKQVFSFLAVDVKGFFNHIHHDRLIKVLWDKGFDIPMCLWTKSFASDRSCAFRLDDYLSDTNTGGEG